MFEQRCVARGLVQKTLTLSKYIVNDPVVDEVEYKAVLLFPSSSFFFLILFQIHPCLINFTQPVFFLIIQ